MDTLISYGGALKSLGGGKIEGFLVVFSDAESPDLEGDFFTQETDFDLEDGDARTGYYSHGLDLTVKNQKIGRGTLKVDEKGVWLEGQLDLRYEYADAILQLAEEGALGLSSGALTHLVRREEVKSGVTRVTHWPIGEWSLTPTPAEPRTKAVALKSLEGGKSLEELRKRKATESTDVKGLLSEYAPKEMTWAALRSLNDSLFYSVLWGILYDEDLTAEEREAKLNQAFDEFRDLAVNAITSFLAEPTTSAEMKTTLRHLWGNPKAEPHTSTFSERTAALVSEAADIATSLESRKVARATEGRKPSPSDQENAKAIAESLSEVKERYAALISAENPTPTDPPFSPTAQLLRMRLQANLALQNAAAS